MGPNPNCLVVLLVLLVLLGFVVLLPAYILWVLVRNKKQLHSPRMLNQFGFLYARFVRGAELWEVHELYRKMLLCGLLVGSCACLACALLSSSLALRCALVGLLITSPIPPLYLPYLPPCDLWG